MIDGENATAFPYKHQSKDLAYALDLAQSLGVRPRVATAALDYYASDRETAEALADKDFSAVMAAVRANGGSSAPM